MEVASKKAERSAFRALQVSATALKRNLRHNASKERKMKTVASKERFARPRGLPHLRILRQREGLSLSQLADMTGLRRDTIAHLEAGCEDPQPYHIRVLAHALNVRQFDVVS
jgi:ribosome-binding protein aMBF1 (putative translation factor)